MALTGQLNNHENIANVTLLKEHIGRCYTNLFPEKYPFHPLLWVNGYVIL